MGLECGKQITRQLMQGTDGFWVNTSDMYEDMMTFIVIMEPGVVRSGHVWTLSANRRSRRMSIRGLNGYFDYGVLDLLSR